MDSTAFQGVSLYIHGSLVTTGTLSIIETIFSIVVVLKEEDSSFENPLIKDKYLINPLTDPYIIKDQHHLIDTTFYSDLTIIDQPQRICFLDSTQELGITVHFPNKEVFDAFYNEFCKHVTILSQNTKGIFKITAQYPSFYPDSDYVKQRKNRKRDFLKAPSLPNENIDSYLQKHANLLELISAFKSEDDKKGCNPESEISYNSIDDLKKYIRSHHIDANQKAKVWFYLIEIDINNIDKKLIERYQCIKNQWEKIRYSQFKRTDLFKEHIDKLKNEIYKFKQKLLTVVYDFSILKITFNIIMSITQIYYDFHSHYHEILYLIRVFYSIFVKDVVYDKENLENDEPFFVINDETTVNSETFESLVFWSMLVLIEKGRIKQVLASIDSNDFENITITISDFLYVVDPILFYSYLYQNNNKILEFIPEITMAMSGTLALCDCSDLWIAALSADNISQFLNFYLLSVLLMTFPPEVFTNSSKQNIQPIQKKIQMFDHWEIMKLAFKLQDSYPDLMKQKT